MAPIILLTVLALFNTGTIMFARKCAWPYWAIGVTFLGLWFGFGTYMYYFYYYETINPVVVIAGVFFAANCGLALRLDHPRDVQF